MSGVFGPNQFVLARAGSNRNCGPELHITDDDNGDDDGNTTAATITKPVDR